MTSWLLCILIRLCSLYSVFMYDGSSEHFVEGMGYSKEMLSKVRDGYGLFSVFLESLFTCIASMHDEWVEQLIHQVMPAVETLLPELDVNNLDMPQPLLTAITEMPKAFVRIPISQLKNMFHRSANVIKKRPNSISNALNEVLNFLDTIYKIKKGQNISQDLEDCKGYPTIGRTPEKLVHDTIKDVVIYPFLSLKSAEQRYLIMSLNRVVESDYSIQLMLPLFTTRRKYKSVKTTDPSYQGSHKPLRNKTPHYRKQKSEQNEYSNNAPETNKETPIISESSEVVDSTNQIDIQKVTDKIIYGHIVPSNLMPYKKNRLNDSHTKFRVSQKTAWKRKHEALVKSSSLYLTANNNKININQNIPQPVDYPQVYTKQKSEYDKFPNSDTEVSEEDYYFLKIPDNVNATNQGNIKKKTDNKLIPSRLLPSNLVPYNKNRQKDLNIILRQRKLTSSKGNKDIRSSIEYNKETSASKEHLIRKTIKQLTVMNRINPFVKKGALQYRPSFYRLTTLSPPSVLSNLKSKYLRNETPSKKKHFLFIVSGEVSDLVTNTVKHNLAQMHEILPKASIDNNHTEKETKIIPVDEIKFLIGNNSRTIYVETSGHKKQKTGVNTDFINLPILIRQSSLLTTTNLPLNIQKSILNVEPKTLSSEVYHLRNKMSPYDYFTNQMDPNIFNSKSDRINIHNGTPAQISTDLKQNRLKLKNHKKKHSHRSLHTEIHHVKIKHPRIYRKYIEGNIKYHKTKPKDVNYLQTLEKLTVLRRQFSSIKPFVQKSNTENDVSYSNIDYSDNSSQVTEIVGHTNENSKATKPSLDYYWNRTRKLDASDKIINTSSPLKEKHNHDYTSYESYADTSFEVKLSNQLVKNHLVIVKNEMTEHSRSAPEISQTEEKRYESGPNLRTQRFSMVKLTTNAISKANTTDKTESEQTLKQNKYNYLGSSSVTSFEITYKEVYNETTQFSLNRNESKPTEQITKSSLQETKRVSNQSVTENAPPPKFSNLNIMLRQSIVKTNDMLSDINEKLNSNKTLSHSNRKLSSNNELHFSIENMSQNNTLYHTIEKHSPGNMLHFSIEKVNSSDTLHNSIEKLSLNNTIHQTTNILSPNDTIHRSISKPKSNYTLHLSVIKLVSKDT